MGDNSKIEWTDATWSPVLGCNKVSPACKHCYAEPITHRLAKNPNAKIAKAYAGLTNENGRFSGISRFLPDRLSKPLKWKKPRKIFVNSMSDLFHEGLRNEEIASVFAVMAATPRHRYQVLTKRPERMVEWFHWVEEREKHGRELFPSDSPEWRIRQMLYACAMRHTYLPPHHGGPWPLPNVWLGVSVENQEYADRRIPLLLKTPAAVRFLSCEPLLGPIDLEPFITSADSNGEPSGPRCDDDGRCVIRWVIVGGESGNAKTVRPMHPNWARDLRDQCQEAGIAFHFKQHGAWKPLTFEEAQAEKGWGERSDLCVRHLNGCGGSAVMSDAKRAWDNGTRPFKRVGKKRAGRLLDGREWNESPDVEAR